MTAKPNELRLIREYDAPVRLVWEAWTDPAQAAQWWGPRGFTLTTHSKDLRPGGHWTYTMHGPDGTDYENKAIYHEVEEGAKLVYDHGGNDDRPPLFRVTVLFRETNGKTTMDLTMSLATPEAAQQIKGFIKQAGGNATWDRLGEYLEKDRTTFVIHRTFEAPRETVFALWTDPRHLAQWLPPEGFAMEVLHADIRTGGKLFFRMSNGEFALHTRFVYRDVQAPVRLVYAQTFCDETQEPSRHPMAPELPETLLVTVEFFAESVETTRVRVLIEAASASAAENTAFANLRGSMTMGWTGSFDKLESLLQSLTPS
jgi:uncharacterized protein YndB with AHSA1/START domain